MRSIEFRAFCLRCRVISPSSPVSAWAYVVSLAVVLVIGVIEEEDIGVVCSGISEMRQLDPHTGQRCGASTGMPAL